MIGRLKNNFLSMYEKGFIHVLIVIAVTLFIGVGGYFFIEQKKDVSEVTELSVVQPEATTTSPTLPISPSTSTLQKPIPDSVYSKPSTQVSSQNYTEPVTTNTTSSVNYTNVRGPVFYPNTTNVTNTLSPSIKSLEPASGKIGSVVIVQGVGFDASQNVVQFGGGYVGYADSADGTTLSFVVPAEEVDCHPSGTPCYDIQNFQVTPGTYNISISNKHGTSNTVSFTVVQ